VAEDLGMVDEYFFSVVEAAGKALTVETVNFREWQP
jgi:hypothetical protein